MEAVLTLATALAGWGFAVFLTVNQRADERLIREQHASELAIRDAKLTELLDQVQLNSQNLPYYPTLGPFPAPTGPEPRWLSDEFGLYAATEDELTEAYGELDRSTD